MRNQIGLCLFGDGDTVLAAVPLRLSWSPDAVQELSTVHGMNVTTELVDFTANEIKRCDLVTALKTLLEKGSP